MSDETLKLPGLPEPAVIDTHLPTGVRIYGHTADQLRELQRQTVEVCAKVAEAYEPYGGRTQSDIVDAIRSLLKDQS